MLAYVDAGTTDIGLAMIRAGHADVFVFEGRPFARLPTYERALAEASTAGRGVWGACGGDFHRQGPPDDTATGSRSESAERFVRRYYFLLNQRRFPVAWAKLSPRLRGQLGPQSRWRSGYRRTLGTRVNSVSVSLAAGRAIVNVRIRSRDRDMCSGRVVRQFFRGRWVLRKVGGGAVRLSRSDCAPARTPSRRPREPDAPAPDNDRGTGCHPSYDPCVPNDRDHDCGELPNTDYAVTGPDEYRLDGDSDGIGCES